jgi:hypothetical protein
MTGIPINPKMTVTPWCSRASAMSWEPDNVEESLDGMGMGTGVDGRGGGGGEGDEQIDR